MKAKALLLLALPACANIPVSRQTMHARPVSVMYDPDIGECRAHALWAATQWWRAQGVDVDGPVALDTDRPVEPGDVYVVGADLSGFIVGDGTALGLTSAMREGDEIIAAVIILDSCHPIVAAHEIGHALGLGHNEEPGSLMMPELNDDIGWGLSPLERDIVGL